MLRIGTILALASIRKDKLKPLLIAFFFPGIAKLRSLGELAILSSG